MENEPQPRIIDYECLRCGVEGRGSECWFCGDDDELAKMKKLSHPALQNGVLISEILDP